MARIAPEQWQRIRRHLEVSLELHPEERAAYLDGLRSSEPRLHAEVASLIDAHDRAQGASSLFAGPAPSLLSHPPSARAASGSAHAGPYRLGREIGSGGMGTVYLAERTEEGCPRVAIKILRRGLDAPDLVHRFERERRILARLDHPHIARLLDGGSMPDGRPFLVMEWIDGLRSDVHWSRNRISVPGRLDFFRKVCLAVHYAHQHGIVHGDLKPANVMVSRTGEPKLLDFGVSRLLSSKEGTGQPELRRDPRIGEGEPCSSSGDATAALTPDYSSPEQLLRRPITTASDVYSLGIVLFQLLTGVLPFEPVDVRRLSPSEMLADLTRRRVPALAQAAAARVQDADRPESPLDELTSLGKLLLTDLENIVRRALATEPSGRYATAGDLAADLDRLLNGEAVESTPHTLPYLARKLVRRHPALATVTAATILALSSLGAALLHQGWRAERRARLAQHFAQQAQQIEAIARSVALLPPVAGRLQEQSLRRRVEHIRKEVKELGRDAEGPAAYALGVGSLALADYERAQAHLERAWQDGFRTPPVARALGSALSIRYRRSLQEAERIGPPELRRQARALAAATFRAPAVQYLEIARAEDPRLARFLDASLADYGGRLDEAAAKARDAFAELPWLYEAKWLEGDVYLEQAARARDREDVPTALGWYEEAGHALAQAIAVARNQPLLLSAECARRGAVAELTPGALESQDLLFAEALSVCDQALELNGALADVVVEKAHLYLQRGRKRIHSATSPDLDLAEAERLASTAVVMEPRNANAHLQLGLALRELAIRRGEQGIALGDLLRRAEEALRQALDLNPASAHTLSGLGAVHSFRARHAQEHGEDSAADFRSAIAAYRAALELVPDYSRALNNIGACQLADATFRGARSDDSELSFHAAIDSFRRALAISPRVPTYHNNLGNAHLELAFHQYRHRGADPGSRIEEAVLSYREAIRLDAAYALPWYNLALAEKLRGRARLARGEDPEPSLRRALAALEESKSRASGMPGIDVERAATLVLLARSKVSRGGNPRTYLRQADAAIERAIELSPASSPVLLGQAQLSWWAARWEGQGSGARRSLIERGRAATQRALRIDGNDPEALALAGAIELLAAHAEPDGPSRLRIATAAKQSLERALELDPYLDSELRSLLLEARMLADSKR